MFTSDSVSIALLNIMLLSIEKTSNEACFEQRYEYVRHIYKSVVLCCSAIHVKPNKCVLGVCCRKGSTIYDTQTVLLPHFDGCLITYVEVAGSKTDNHEIRQLMLMRHIIDMMLQDNRVYTYGVIERSLQNEAVRGYSNDVLMRVQELIQERLDSEIDKFIFTQQHIISAPPPYTEKYESQICKEEAPPPYYNCLT